MFTTKRRNFLVSGLAVAVGALSLSGVLCATGVVASADTSVEPDHKVAYYMQAYKPYGGENKVQSVGLPEKIGIKTLNANYQYTTNNRFNDSANDNPAHRLHPEAQDGGYNGDGKLWGVYYNPEKNVQHYEIDASQAGEGKALRGTPFETAMAAQKDNTPLTFKFQLDDATTKYNVVIGANATPLNGWGGTGSKSTGDVYVNGSDTAAASFENMGASTFVVLNDVSAVHEDTNGDGTEDAYILTLTVKAHDEAGTQRPVVSFISVADASSTAPAYLSAECNVVNVGLSAETLPSTVEVLTTAGVQTAPVTWTDKSEFEDSVNKNMFNTVTVKGTVTVSGFEYEASIPVQFVPENVYYYTNISYASVESVPEMRSVNSTFAAIKSANSDTLLNDKLYQVSDGSNWGVESPNWITWMGNDILWSANPYASITKAGDAAAGSNNKILKLNFPNLPVGKYSVYLGAREPSGWGGRETAVKFNGTDAGTFTTTAEHDDLGMFAFEQTTANKNLEVALYGPDGGSGDVILGFVVITEYQEPVQEIHWGDDTDQEYFLNAGDSSSARVEGIGRPYYQTSFHRAYNAPNGGEVTPDETGRAWGFYYNSDMAAGYYASAGAGTTPFSSMVYTNLNAANREMIFKFDMKDATTEYDVVIGFSNTWSIDNGNNRGAKITINGAAEPAALVTNLGYNKAVCLSKVTAAALDADTNRENVLTISLGKPNAADGSEPTVSFISIRESSKDPVFIAGAEIAVAIEKSATALPQTVEVLTTAGYKTANVTWADDSGFKNSDKKYFLGMFEAAGTVSFDGESYPVTAKFIYVDTKDAYYYIDNTIVDADGNTFLAPIAQAAFDAMKANGTLLNDKADGKSVDGSWGNLNVNDTTHYFGYEANPYLSIMESAEQEGGLYWLMYSFPSLKAGDYLVQIGVCDPWGPRPSDVMINGSSVGTLNTQTGKDIMTSFIFTQSTDDAAIKLDMTGVDGQLAGFIVIRKIDAADTAENLSILSNAHNFFFTQGTDIDVTGLSVLVDMGDYSYVRAVTRSMVSGYDANKVGEQTVTVTCAGKTVQYKVTVLENKKTDEGEEKPKGGCNGSIGSVGAIGMLVTLVAGASVMVLRKKRDR